MGLLLVLLLSWYICLTKGDDKYLYFSHSSGEYCLSEGREISTLDPLTYYDNGMSSNEHNLFWALYGDDSGNSYCLKIIYENDQFTYTGFDGNTYSIQHDATFGDGRDISIKEKNLKGDPTGVPNSFYPSQKINVRYTYKLYNNNCDGSGLVWCR